MKTRHIAVVVLLGACAAGCTIYVVPGDPPPAASPEVEASDFAGVEIGIFDDELSPYGRWIERPAYGRVWLPSGVAAGWRPYTLGHWVETDYGWTWISDEPFGWATYHYGRWAYDPELGWLWVPGREWGPAWVAWERGGGYVGWAPLPPAVRFRVGVGLDLGGVDLRVAIAPHHYCFVEERTFLEPRVVEHVVPPARNVTIIHNTVNITNYKVIDRRVVNRSVEVDQIERVTGHKVQRYRVTDATPGDRQRNPRIEGDQITLYRPKVPASPPPGRGGNRKNRDAGGERTEPGEPGNTGRHRAEGAKPAAPPAPPETPTKPAGEDTTAKPRPRGVASPEGERRRDDEGRARQNAEEDRRRNQEEQKARDEERQRDRRQVEDRRQRDKDREVTAQGKDKDKDKDKEKEKDKGKDKRGERKKEKDKEKDKDKNKDKDKDKDKERETEKPRERPPAV
jgi:uncharacterized protein DUF6600